MVRSSLFFMIYLTIRQSILLICCYIFLWVMKVHINNQSFHHPQPYWKVFDIPNPMHRGPKSKKWAIKEPTEIKNFDRVAKIKDSALTSPYPPSLGNKCDVAIYWWVIQHCYKNESWEVEVSRFPHSTKSISDVWGTSTLLDPVVIFQK